MKLLKILFALFKTYIRMMELQTDYQFVLRICWRVIYNKVRQFSLMPETVIRATNNGLVKGVKRCTMYNKNYFSFEGIPFAKPPIGALRFQEPQPAEPWEGVRDCSYFRAKPMQKNLLFKFVEGAEDCLYLSIFVKELTSEKPLPVIIWIHGGGFQIGEASRDFYSPDYFMEENLVMVHITYRLGAFGFLSLNDRKLNIPGNAGLKDQIMAIQWVKQNIHNFNGDPNNITLMGQSAGSLSAHLLMCCNRARGLFHKAILMSSSALCTWSIFPQHKWAYRLASELGYIGENEDANVLDFLLKVDAYKIANVHSFLMNKQERLDRYNAPFGPIIEPYITENAVLTKPVEELLKNAWGNEIPVILGATSLEGLLMYGNAKEYPYLINELGDCTDLIPREVQAVSSESEIKEMALKLKRFYFNNENPYIDKHIHKYIEIVGDYILLHGIHRALISRLIYAPSKPTYYYRFDYDSDFNIFRQLWVPQKIRGVTHSSDVQYLFFNMFSLKFNAGSTEYELSKRMIGMWTAFAYNGDPNCEKIQPTKWLPANDFPLNNMKCLKIAEDILMTEVPEQKKLNLWDSFYEKVKWL